MKQTLSSQKTYQGQHLLGAVKFRQLRSQRKEVPALDDELGKRYWRRSGNAWRAGESTAKNWQKLKLLCNDAVEEAAADRYVAERWNRWLASRNIHSEVHRAASMHLWAICNAKDPDMYPPLVPLWRTSQADAESRTKTNLCRRSCC